MEPNPPSTFSRRLALLAFALAAGLGLRFVLLLPPPAYPPPPAIAPLPPPGELRIAVVRLQHIVDRYDRYIYATARLTEAFKREALAARNTLDEIETEIAAVRQIDTDDQMIALVLDQARFTQWLRQRRELGDRNLTAGLRLKQLEILKEDLNTEMSLATMEDIAAVIHEVAAEAGYDAVTDCVSDFTAPTEYNVAGLWFDNLKHRAPVIYAAPPHDLTTAVLERLNARYHATFGAGNRSDPLLTADLESLARRLQPRLEDFQQRRARPPKTRPLKLPHHPGLRVAVVNLERVIDQLREKTGFNQAYAELQGQVGDLESEARLRQAIYDDRRTELFQTTAPHSRVPRAQTRQLAADGQAAVAAQYQAAYARVLFAAWQSRENAKITRAIQQEIARLAADRHLDLVFAAFGPNPLPDPFDLGPNGMLPWHRADAELDLTAAVLETLTHPKTPRPAPAVDPADGNETDLFNLNFNGPALLRQTLDRWQTRLQLEQATDTERFAAWHRYQQEVLQTPPAATAP